MAVYALWGGLVAMAVVLIVAWWQARRAVDAPAAVAVAVLTGVATIVALVVNQQLISPLIARARPCATLSHVQVLLHCAADYSMPSDHCIIAGAFVAGLWLLNRAAGALALVFALVLAFGRVYTGVHYPTDTIIGLLAGALIGVIIVLGLRQTTTTLATWLTTTQLRKLIIARPAAPAHTSG